MKTRTDTQMKFYKVVARPTPPESRSVAMCISLVQQRRSHLVQQWYNLSKQAHLHTHVAHVYVSSFLF
jgi:hypothetical protein